MKSNYEYIAAAYGATAVILGVYWWRMRTRLSRLDGELKRLREMRGAKGQGRDADE